MKTFGVVTPTVGSNFLSQCIESIHGQDCLHYIWVDGKQYRHRVDEILDKCWHENLRVNYLEDNVGRNGGEFYGHRIYASCPSLVNTDYISFLDEDNWVEQGYIKAFRDVLSDPKYQWAYTLRKIVDPDGKYICHDDCESLGHWKVMGTENRYHVDTGCFVVSRSVAVNISSSWVPYGWGADRQFFGALKAAAPSFGCTNQYTLNYRLGGATNMATQEMFVQGNKITTEMYKGELPWRKLRERKPMTWTYQTTPQKSST